MHQLIRFTFMLAALSVIYFAANAGASDSTTSQDVRFVYVAKWSNYAQGSDGTKSLLDYGYGAQIFAFADGRISAATLAGPLPGGTEMQLGDDGDQYPGRNLRFTGEPQRTLQALDREFPDGDYALTLQTASGEFAGHILSFTRHGDALAMASPPNLSLKQCGRAVANNEIHPQTDLTVVWTAFAGAADDPRAVMDDLIVVKFGRSDGTVIRRSPLPYFGRGPAIHHTATEHTLLGDLLQANGSFQIEVEHINIVDSGVRDAIPEVAAYVTNVKLPVQVLAQPCSQ